MQTLGDYLKRQREAIKVSLSEGISLLMPRPLE